MTNRIDEIRQKLAAAYSHESYGNPLEDIITLLAEIDRLGGEIERMTALLSETREALEKIIKRTNGPSYTMAGVIQAIASAALSRAIPEKAK